MSISLYDHLPRRDYRFFYLCPTVSFEVTRPKTGIHDISNVWNALSDASTAIPSDIRNSILDVSLAEFWNTVHENTHRKNVYTRCGMVCYYFIW